MNSSSAAKTPNILQSFAQRFSRRTVERRSFADRYELEAWIIDWISRKLDIPAADVRTDVPFIELGMDSLLAVELSGRLEEVTGKTLSPSAAWEYPTVSEIAMHLMANEDAREGDMDDSAADAV